MEVIAFTSENKLNEEGLIFKANENGEPCVLLSGDEGLIKEKSSALTLKSEVKPGIQFKKEEVLEVEKVVNKIELCAKTGKCNDLSLHHCISSLPAYNDTSAMNCGEEPGATMGNRSITGNTRKISRSRVHLLVKEVDKPKQKVEVDAAMSFVPKEREVDCEDLQFLKSNLFSQSGVLTSNPNEKLPSKSSHVSKVHEIERTCNHISYLLKKLPELAAHFEIHRKIGEGTFSSVFLGTLKQETVFQYPQFKDEQFAIKHLVPTILPKRIAKELKFLQQIGGRENVVGVDLCLRKDDCVVFVMPYLPHKRFSEYVLDMDAEETREYMRNLMIALQRVHSFNVIHRDVKPSNFLYNHEEKRFLLVDFGLSQRLPSPSAYTECGEDKVRKRKRHQDDTPAESMKENNTAARWAVEEGARGKRAALQSRNRNEQNIMRLLSAPRPLKRRRLDESPTLQQSSKIRNDFNIRKKLFTSSENTLPCPRSDGSPRISRATQPSPTIFQPLSYASSPLPVSQLCSQASARSSNTEPRKFHSLAPSRARAGPLTVRVQNSQVQAPNTPMSPLESEQHRKVTFSSSSGWKGCGCMGRPQVCKDCTQRRAPPAPRAGTPGFRPPEVLLKCPQQSTAVDMWAAGVILLCILSGCYPFFRSPDDVSALAEIMTIFGTDRIKNVAKSLGRVVQCSEHRQPLDLRELCRRLRQARTLSRQSSPSDGAVLQATAPLCAVCSPSTMAEMCLCMRADDVFPASAYDLLERLLNPNPATRLSATLALGHPFLQGPAAP